MKLEEVAHKMNISTSQLALAWVLSNGDDLIPIPGTKKKVYLEENVAATDINLPLDIKAIIDEIAPIGRAAGNRYPSTSMNLINK